MERRGSSGCVDDGGFDGHVAGISESVSSVVEDELFSGDGGGVDG